MKNFNVFVIQCGSLKIVRSEQLQAKNVEEARIIAETRYIKKGQTNLFTGASAI